MAWKQLILDSEANEVRCKVIFHTVSSRVAALTLELTRARIGWHGVGTIVYN